MIFPSARCVQGYAKLYPRSSPSLPARSDVDGGARTVVRTQGPPEAVELRALLREHGAHLRHVPPLRSQHLPLKRMWGTKRTVLHVAQSNLIHQDSLLSCAREVRCHAILQQDYLLDATAENICTKARTPRPHHSRQVLLRGLRRGELRGEEALRVRGE